MNGIGGNLVSVQASRISTLLHQTTPTGSIPAGQKIFELPWKALFYGTPYSQASCIFLIMSVPGQILFIYLADFMHMGESTIGAPFVLSYITAAVILVRVFFSREIFENFFEDIFKNIFILILV
jgi:solute carrier family 41